MKHVKKVGNYVRNAYPGITPLIWDDMLRHWSLFDLEESQLGAVVEPVVSCLQKLISLLRYNPMVKRRK